MDLMRLPASPDQTTRRLVLLFQSVSAELADRLAGAAAAREVLPLTVAYQPPADEYAAGGWTVTAFLSDGTKLPVRWMTRPAFSDADTSLPLPLHTTQRRGVAHEPEVMERLVSDVSGHARLRLVAAHLDPAKRSMFRTGETRSGFVLVECEGTPWAPWRRPGKAEMPRGTHPVYHDGHFLGRAAVEGGAARVAAAQPFAPRADHGWRLIETPIGKLWVVRPPDDIAHRIREVRRDLVPFHDRLDELAKLDLSEEPARTEGLIEEIEQLAARVDALRAAARLPPRRGKAGKPS
ncbi:hypothetical protein GBZ48_35135 [Azospirillum melinis]|uniref:Uncharacterized protein n=1 Tax=Azospirillum melinis TaxID=328839 RepID=A0ABX2KV55_9PROT|nr:hypothetical protein [Azospirillum melinis]MBP2310455.1 hypothetical protein [Azospirillum melinis]NUB04432.1 hypothetical protein [Azospirillum melinis]